MSANFFRIRNRKLFGISLILVAVGILFALLDLIYPLYFKGNWGKIVIIIIPILIAINEWGDIFNVESNQKKALYVLLITLFLTTVWDTTYDTKQSIKEAIKRDSLTNVESIRFQKIFNDLRTTIDELDKTSSLVLTTNDTLQVVKDCITSQVVTLKDVIKKSSDYIKLQREEFSSQAPNIIIRQKYLNLSIDSTGMIKTIVIPLVNIGKRSAKNAKLYVRLFSYNHRTDKLIDLMNASQFQLKELIAKDIPPRQFDDDYSGVSLNVNRKIDFFQSDFIKEWIAVVSLRYEDDFGKGNKKTLYILGQYLGDEKFLYHQSIGDNHLKAIRDFYKENNESKYLFDE